MKYIGGKSQIVHDMLYPMLKKRGSRQHFIDLFCGGCAVTQHVRNPRIANDIDEQLIAMFIALVNGWEPPTVITELDYYRIKLNEEQYDSELIAFVSYVCSFGSKKWGGYARDGNGGIRNYALAGHNQLVESNLTMITFGIGLNGKRF